MDEARQFFVREVILVIQESEISKHQEQKVVRRYMIISISFYDISMTFGLVSATTDMTNLSAKCPLRHHDIIRNLFGSHLKL